MDHEIALRRFYTVYKYNSGRDGRTFLLSFEDYLDVVKKDCFYCGEPPAERKWRNKSAFVNGIDRSDNSRGYEVDNVLPCCNRCNFCKGRLGTEEFIEQVSKIFMHKKGQ